MPWKLIGLILLLVLVAVFASFNLSNKADISLGFTVFKEVPIFLSLLMAFLAGALLMIPFTFGPSARKLKIRKTKKAEVKARGQEPAALPDAAAPLEELPQELAPAVEVSPKKPEKKRRRKKKHAVTPEPAPKALSGQSNQETDPKT